MSSELSILALYGLLTLLAILIQVLLATPALGIPYLVSARDTPREMSGTAGRALRAQSNSVYALAMFAPAILLLAVKDGFSGSSLLAAQAFLIARILYLPIYYAGIPWVRTLVWLVGFLATAWLYLLAL